VTPGFASMANWSEAVCVPMWAGSLVSKVKVVPDRERPGVLDVSVKVPGQSVENPSYWCCGDGGEASCVVDPPKSMVMSLVE